MTIEGQSGTEGAPTRRGPASRGTGADESLTLALVPRLRHMLVHLQLAPGEPLHEARLAEQLGTSRTPVREALKLLASEGLVVLRRNRSAIAAPLAPEALVHLFEVEAAIEGIAAGLAAQRLTARELARLARLQRDMEGRHRAGDLTGYILLNQKIHSLIVAGAHNPALVETHAHLIGRLQRARNLALTVDGRVEESIREHREILAALEARDATAAEQLFRRHVERTGAIVAGICATLVLPRGRTRPRKVTQ